MVLQLYYDLLSQPCRSVYLFLKATGIEFEAIELELLKGEQRNPENIKKYPYHKLPFIDDDGFVLAESVAIMSYISNKYKTKIADHWYPRNNVQQQAKFEEFMHWQQMNIRKQGSEVFLNTLKSRLTLGPLIKQPIDQAIVGKAKEELKKAIKHLDEYYLQDNPFIAGKEISAADFQGMVELYQLRGAEEEEIYMSNKKVAAWMKRVEDRLAPHSTQANMKINGLRAKFIEAK